MAAIAVTVAEEVEKKAAEYLVAWVCRHCGYLIFSNRKVRQLKAELEKLDPASQRVQHRTEVARRNMKPIEADVEKWMGEVKTVTTEARNLLQDHDGRGNPTCLYGWLPNPKARYRLGKEASRMVKDIPGLIERGQFPEVAFENPPRGLVMDGAPNLIISDCHHGGTIIESRASILENIMNALNDEKLTVIGIYGPGGVGKTTLLGEVEEKLRKEKRPFHMIAPTKVSQTPDLKKIQDDIAYALSLDLKNEPSEVGRRDRLFLKLQSDSTEKVLIILDDLWKKLDLKEVGIPSGHESSKCKLLLTSRYKDVLTEMQCAPSIFHLEGLKYEEALRLFEEKVGDKLKDDEDVRAIAPEVVKKLAGLPLLINSVAITLKDSDLSAWKTALKKMDVTNIETIVKLSYDRLRSEDAKTLFRVCGLIGGIIEVELLLGLGMGLGLFEEFNNTIEDARLKLSTMVTSLRSVCLLEDGGDDEEEVTIHDLYSEVVVSTQLGAQDSLVMNSSSWREKNLGKCWAIRLADVGRDRLAQLATFQFPNLEILMLSEHGGRRLRSNRHDDARDCCGPLDFNCMKELRVLYLHAMHIAPLPSSIEILKNLRSLYLDRCRVGDVAILGELKALEILSFEMSTISTLPKEIGGLTKLRSLNLSDCDKLKIIERGALEGLINLEELYMKGSFDRWMGEDKEPSESCNVRLAELKSLTKLTALEISIPDPALLLEDGALPFGNLIRFRIEIGGAYCSGFESSRQMMLNLGGCDRILSKDGFQKTLQRTQDLYLEGLRDHSKESAHELCLGGFSQLKRLVIKKCSWIKYIAAGSSNGHQPLSAFPSLESLYLDSLDNLEKICHAHVECFGKLKELTVQHCPQLKSLWCLSDKQTFVHLEEIMIWSCKSMQAIITYDATNVEAATSIVELPNVRRLALLRLPNVTSFCIEDNGAPIQVSFPLLQDVNVKYCPQLQNLFCLLDKQRLMHLEVITISECDSMQAIITYNATNVEAAAADGIVELPSARSVELKYLRIMTSFCMDTDGAPIQVSFPHLENLKMDSLPNLEKICHAPVDKECFGKLEDVTVRYCNRLKNLWCLSEKQGLVNLQRVEVEKCESMQTLITYDARNVEAAADGVVQLPNVLKLNLHELPRMASFCIGADGAPAQVSFLHLENLIMDRLPNLEKICHAPVDKECFGQLEDVSVRNCNRLKNLWCLSEKQGLVNLQRVEVEECESMQALITYDARNVEAAADGVVQLPSVLKLDLRKLPRMASFCIGADGAPAQVSFPHLENLEMIHLPNLEKICHAPVDKECIGKLESVTVSNCNRLKNLWCLSEKQGLVNLQRVKVEECESMQALITYDARNEEVAADGVVQLPNVLKLHLRELPSMTSFCIGADGAPAQVSLPCLEWLMLTSVKSLRKIWYSGVPESSFCKLAFLHLDDCPDIVNVFPSSIIGGLHNLKDIYVRNCSSLETLVDFGSLDFNTEQSFALVPKWEEIQVSGVRGQRHVVKSDPPTVWGFPNLRKVTVDHCSRLKYIFPNFLATTLEKIERLSIINCEQMKEVILREEGGQSMERVMSFPSLNVLQINKCPNVGAFIRSPTSAERLMDEMVEENNESALPFFNEMVAFPNITELTIEGIRCEKLWNNQIPHDSFCNLNNLYLKDCDKLQNIASSYMWKRLQCCLETLQVSSCGLIKVIYEGDGTDTGSGKLRTLIMRDLGSLEHIWEWRSDGQPNVPFPNLRHVGAVRCSRLTRLFESFTEKFLGQMEELVVEECENMDLIAGREKGEGAITFFKLTALVLLKLPEFRSFLPENYSPNFPSLRVLNRKSCGKEPDQSLGDWEDFCNRWGSPAWLWDMIRLKPKLVKKPRLIQR